VTRRVSENLQQGRDGGEGTRYRGDNTCQKKSTDTVQPWSRVFLRKSFLGQATGGVCLWLLIVCWWNHCWPKDRLCMYCTPGILRGGLVLLKSARNWWQRLGCCRSADKSLYPTEIWPVPFAFVEQPRWATACDMSWIVGCRRSSCKLNHWFIRLIVSLVIMALTWVFPIPHHG